MNVMNNVINEMIDKMNVMTNVMNDEMNNVINEMIDKLIDIKQRIEVNFDDPYEYEFVNDIYSAIDDANIAILYNAESDYKYLNYIADELDNVNLSLINLDLDFTESEYAVFKDCLNLVADCKELLNSLIDF